MTDGGTRVPLIANWPSVISQGRVCDDLVDFSDFLPTLCEATGAAIPSALKIDGRSFLPQLRGEKGNPRDWIYCWYSRNGSAARKKEWARNQQFKLYRTGEFYDVQNDVLEQNPLRVNDLGNVATQAYVVLQEALDQYRDARPLKYRKEE